MIAIKEKIDKRIAEKTKENTGLFEREDLENILIKAVSLQYDTKLKCTSRDIAIPVKCNLSDCLTDVRSTGVTVVPENRLMLRQYCVDERVDVFPETACFFDYWGGSSNDKSEMPEDGYKFFDEKKEKPVNYYSSAYFIKRINKLPPFWRCDGDPYKIYWLYSLRFAQKTYDIWRHVGAFDKNGEQLCTYFMDKAYVQPNYRSTMFKRFGKYKGYFTETVGFTIQQYNDKRYLWNVTAIEGDAKINIGCYKENIKSLFYARQLPVTATGRKRPILHWVKAHKRRIKEGIDINIEKYLRGVTEIEMDNTKFIIASPQKDVGL